MDLSGTQWVTAFGDAAEAITGRSAKELGELKDNDKDKDNAVHAPIFCVILSLL